MKIMSNLMLLHLFLCHAEADQAFSFPFLADAGSL
jgi:hypothetical protein